MNISKTLRSSVRLNLFIMLLVGKSGFAVSRRLDVPIRVNYVGTVQLQP